MRNKSSVLTAMSIAIALCAISCTKPSAGRGQIVGFVSQSSNGEPIEGVFVEYGDTSVLTNKLGYYQLDTIPDGPQGITYSKMGYETVITKVDVPRDGTLQNDVKMDVLYSAWAVGEVEENYGSIFYTDNGGFLWQRQGNVHSVPADALFGVCAVNNKVCWVVGDSTLNVKTSKLEFLILKTSDAGQTWVRQGTSISTPAAAPLVSVCAVDTTSAWAVSSSNFILSTSNGGQSWAKCYESNGIPSFSCISTDDGEKIWAAGSPSMEDSVFVAFSPDAGKNWTQISVPILSTSDTIYDIRAVRNWGVYIAGTFGVALSHNLGRDWEIVAPTSFITTSFCVISTINSWMTDGAGINYSTDLLQTIEKAQVQAETDQMVFSCISFAGDGEVGAASYLTPNFGRGGGLLFSQNSGHDWQEAVIPYKIPLYAVSYAGARH